jgi:hypothetical protein
LSRINEIYRSSSDDVDDLSSGVEMKIFVRNNPYPLIRLSAFWTKQYYEQDNRKLTSSA